MIPSIDQFLMLVSNVASEQTTAEAKNIVHMLIVVTTDTWSSPSDLRMVHQCVTVQWEEPH